MDYEHHHQTDQHVHHNHKNTMTAYYPLFLIAAYIIGVTTINNFDGHYGIHWHNWMMQLMAGFFLVFSSFKFLDLPGFASGYARYDLLAKHWLPYGYIYPFIELALGILFLTQRFETPTLIATIIVMGFSSIGVMVSLFKKQQFQCACLGTLIKVPLSNVTLIEDLLMVIMAILGLISR